MRAKRRDDDQFSVEGVFARPDGVGYDAASSAMTVFGDAYVEEMTRETLKNIRKRRKVKRKKRKRKKTVRAEDENAGERKAEETR